MGCGSSSNVQVAQESNTDRAVHDKEHTANSKISTQEKSKETAPHVAVNSETFLQAGAEKSESEDEPTVSVGERVHVSGYTGTVRFIGPTDLGIGTWVGVELDRPHRQGNNGSYNGVQYFSCKPKHGLFTRPALVFPHTDIDTITEASEISLNTIVFIQTNIRRFLAKIRLREFQQRTGIEREIDAHVLKTPASKEKNIESLSEYLSAPWETERNKAYSIYRWLTFNVSYDVEGFFGHSAKKSCDAQSVLQNKLSVCAGYANLFEALCKAADLEVHTISGYAKGYGYEVGQQVDGTNHAWNAIRINDEWRICDATWGAGDLGQDMRFQRRPNTHMFLMHSEVAITDHFPEEEKWQLLEHPITREEFAKLAVPSGHLHSMGVEIESHRYAVYEVEEDHIEMQFYSPSTKILSGVLKDNSGKDIGERSRVQIRPCGTNKLKVKAEFPRSGSYKLNLHVRVNGELQHGMSYVIHARRGIGVDKGGFPQFGKEFHDLGFALEDPLENIETKDGKAVISLQCFSRRVSSLRAFLKPVAKDKGDAKKDLNLCYTEKTTNGFAVKVHVPEPGTYKLNMFAKHNETGQPDVYICTYYINAQAGVLPIAGFPRLSDVFETWGLELVEPLENIFTEDGRAFVKLRIPEGISVVGYLKQGNNSLENSLCCTRKQEDGATLCLHAPEAGLFKLNIFGTKSSESSQEYLCTYVVKASRAANENPGFPRLTDDFNVWGLRLAEQEENIITREKVVGFSLLVPLDIDLNPWLFDDRNHQIGGPCLQKRSEGKVEICCELPKRGKYKLNVFGVKKAEDANNSVFLCNVTILYK